MADDITEERRDALLAALQEERRGYEARGLTDRVLGVEGEITRLGGAASPGTQRRPRRAKGGEDA